MLLTKNQTQAPKYNTMVIVLYGGLLIYFLYKIYKTKMAEKKLKGNKYQFKRANSKGMLLLAAFVVAFGIFSIYTKQYIEGILMISLISVVIYEYVSKIVFADNGFVIQSKFIEWKEVKQWNFNDDELIVSYKQGFENQQGFLKVRKEDVEEINKLFRKLKLNK